MNRRTFFQRTAGALATAVLAPYLPVPSLDLTSLGTFDAYEVTIYRIYNLCTSSPHQLGVLTEIMQ